MKTLSDIEFPETPEEAKEWSHTVRRVALHMNVLVVAHTRIEGAWCAYCRPVPGYNHDQEWEGVLNDGTKLSENYARALFPDFAGIPYAR